MASNLHYIPKTNFTEVINNSIYDSDEVVISVSFIFEAGLNLIIEALLNFKDLKSVTIVTSNYLKCTEPEALLSLLNLGKKGAKVYLFDSIKANESFHMKSYLFKNSSRENLIIGSSNLSRTAFKKSHELNVSTSNKDSIQEFKNIVNEIISSQYCYELTQEIIDEYKKVYDYEKNFLLKAEESQIPDDVDVDVDVDEVEPNIVQADCLEILKSEREMGLSKGMVVLATGLGKTYLAALDIKQFNANKILFVAHRDEILRQSAASFNKIMPNKSYGFYQASEKDYQSDFIFASIQTIGRQDNLTNFDPKHFDYIVIDEFHHVGAKSYKNLVDYFKPKFFLGLTATPNRSDNVDILQYCGNNEIYRKDLIDGINLDLLCNFEYYGINDKFVDYSRVSWKANKFDTDELERELIQKKRMEYVFENWLKHKQRRTLGFCTSIKHCELMADFFVSKGYKALAVHSQSKINRTESINKLKNAEIDVLFSVDLFNEGVDIPQIDTLLMARPTESKIIFIQQLGRGLRLSKEEKELVKVIDFIGNHKSFLDKPASLFGFEPNQTNIKKFLKDLSNNELNLPPQTRILYDTESIAFMENLSEVKVDLEEFYKNFKDEKGHRPSASEFYQFIGKVNSLRVTHGSWFDFIDHMDDLSSSESECFNEHKSFFRDLEKTKMTLSFKMVTLRVMVENKFKPMNLDDLCKKSFEFLKESRGLWNEVKSEFKFDSLDNNNFTKWKKYWQSNPIKALTETDPFFKLDEKIFSTNFPISPKYTEDFNNLASELIEYRLASYIVRGNNDYIVNGDLSKPFSSQIFKSFDKKDTPKLFGWQKFNQMTGYWANEDYDDYAIYVTLIKSGLQLDYRYDDYFLNDETFHWQSKKSTTQDTREAADLINHVERGKKIHLFVRKTNTLFLGSKQITPPFTYCGEVKKILKVNGNKPIQVEFTLEEKLPKNIKDEFLRI